MKKFIVGLVMLVMLAGCGAGEAYQLSLADNVIAAASEALKGVEAFNETVIVDTANRQESMIQNVGEGVREVAQDQAMDDEQAAALVQSVMNSLRVHLANYAEQEHRRAHLYEVTVDNLKYIIQISEQGKKYTLYRADIGEQWRAYIESSALNAIGTIE